VMRASSRIGAVLFLGLLVSCQSAPRSETQEAELKNQAGTIEEQQVKIDQLTQDRDALERRNKEIEAKLAKVGTAQQVVEQAKGEMSESVRRVLERFKGDNEIEVVRDTDGGYRFVLRESVLFATGSSDLSDEGRRALGRVAEALKGGNQRISVEGHTDNVPVTKEETRKKYPRGNIELSVGRAFAVYDYLLKDGGIDASRLSVAGFGSTRPVKPNTSDIYKWQNRRVEIRVEER
jgi:chemotaxis protein MotB